MAKTTLLNTAAAMASVLKLITVRSLLIRQATKFRDAAWRSVPCFDGKENRLATNARRAFRRQIVGWQGGGKCRQRYTRIDWYAGALRRQCRESPVSRI